MCQRCVNYFFEKGELKRWAKSCYIIHGITEVPEVFIDIGAQDCLICQAGTQIRIPAVIKGRPTPKSSWEFDGKAKKAMKVRKL